MPSTTMDTCATHRCHVTIETWNDRAFVGLEMRKITNTTKNPQIVNIELTQCDNSVSQKRLPQIRILELVRYLHVQNMPSEHVSDRLDKDVRDLDRRPPSEN